MGMQDHEEAIPYLEKALILRPDNIKASEILAIALVRRTVEFGKSKKNQKAKESIRKAIEIFEDIGNEYRANELKVMLESIPD